MRPKKIEKEQDEQEQEEQEEQEQKDAQSTGPLQNNAIIPTRVSNITRALSNCSTQIHLSDRLMSFHRAFKKKSMP